MTAMVLFGQLKASFAGTVSWVGPDTLKVGKAASLTLRNTTSEAITVQKVVETRTLEESSQILETGSNWSLQSTDLSNPTLHVVPAGGSISFKGSSSVKKVYFGPDVKTEKRKLITYIGTEAEQLVDIEAGNSTSTDPPDPVQDDGALGPYDDFTDLNDAAGGGSGSSSTRGMTILLLLIVVLMAAGGGYAARGAMIRRTLGLG